jgi:DNA-binding protein HU-beta
MKKQDLSNMVNEMIGGTKTQSDAVVQGIFNAMAEEMAKGGVVDIAGFGKFEGAMRDARDARNPRTGETVRVAAKRVPKFKAGKALKDTVKGA